MKILLLLVLVLALFTSCKNDRDIHKATAVRYFESFDAGNYEDVKVVLSDSITIVEGPFVMPFSKESFHEHFKWDSVFQPSYEILEIATKKDSLLVTIRQENRRNAFLENNPLKSIHHITFTSGKISKVQLIEYVTAYFPVWQSKRDSLTRWIKKQHPARDGFVNELTMKGAQEYLEAIGLYEGR